MVNDHGQFMARSVGQIHASADYMYNTILVYTSYVSTGKPSNTYPHPSLVQQRLMYVCSLANFPKNKADIITAYICRAKQGYI